MRRLIQISLLIILSLFILSGHAEGVFGNRLRSHR